MFPKYNSIIISPITFVLVVSVEGISVGQVLREILGSSQGWSKCCSLITIFTTFKLAPVEEYKLLLGGDAGNPKLVNILYESDN